MKTYIREEEHVSSGDMWNEGHLSPSSSHKILSCPEQHRLSKLHKVESYFMHVNKVGKYLHKLVELTDELGPTILLDTPTIFNDIKILIDQNTIIKKELGVSRRDASELTLCSIAKVFASYVYENQLYTGTKELELTHKLVGTDFNGDPLLNANGKKILAKGRPLECDFLGYVDRLKFLPDGKRYLSVWDWKISAKKSPWGQVNYVKQLGEYALVLYEKGLIDLPFSGYLVFAHALDQKYNDLPAGVTVKHYEFYKEDLLNIKTQYFYSHIIRKKGLSFANPMHQYCGFCDYREHCVLNNFFE